LHEGWCRLLVAHIRSRTGAEFDREIEDHGNAVAVLPYDAERRTVILVRLLRTPLLLVGAEAELLEAPAGMIDEEDPDDAVRREAMEEVGLRLGTLEHITRAWSSPGLSTEAIDLYLAPYSPADRVAEGGGLASENEDIEVIELPIPDVFARIAGGDIRDLKTLFLALALKDRHPELFTPA
jgi:nudix-type nucleoside diphosphatase (YffH/AdpP family)